MGDAGRMAFPLTEWTEISRATLHGDPAGRAALEALYLRYRQPVLAFIRHRGAVEQEVEDVAQSFFLHVMETSVLHRADRTQGTFRTFLLTVLKRFLVDRQRSAAAAKRGGGVLPQPLEDAAELAAPQGLEAQAFDREWAVSVMQAALDRVAAEVDAAHGVETWEVLKHFLTTGAAQPTGRTAAEMLEVNENSLKKRIHLWRRRLGECVRIEVRRTVSAPHEVEEEISYLRRLLTGG